MTKEFHRAEMAIMRAEVQAEFAAVRSEFQEGFATLRSEMHQEVAGLRSEVHEGFRRQTTWLVGTMIAMNAVMISALALVR